VTKEIESCTGCERHFFADDEQWVWPDDGQVYCKECRKLLDDNMSVSDELDVVPKQLVNEDAIKKISDKARRRK